MNIQTKKSKKIAHIITSIFVLALVASGITYALTRNNSSGEPTTSTGSVVEDTDITQPSGANIDTKTEPVDNEPDTTTQPNTLQSTITVSDVRGSNVEIRLLINDLVSSGTCVFKAVSGTNGYDESVAIQSLSNASTCKGFTIPTEKLKSGAWTYTITVTSGDKSAVLSGSFNV